MKSPDKEKTVYPPILGMYSEKLDICLKNRRQERRKLPGTAYPCCGYRKRYRRTDGINRNRVNAFNILIAGIALFHHAGAIITADMDFIEIAKYADIDVIRY